MVVNENNFCPPYDKTYQTQGPVQADGSGICSCTIFPLRPEPALRQVQGPGSFTLSRLRPEPALRQAQGPGSGQRLSDRVLSLYLGYGQNPPFDKLRDRFRPAAQGPGSCTISRLLIAYLPFDRLRDRFRPAAQGPGSCTLSRLRPEPALLQAFNKFRPAAQGPGSGQRLSDRVLSLYLGYGQNPPFDKLRDQVQASGSGTGFRPTIQGPVLSL